MKQKHAVNNPLACIHRTSWVLADRRILLPLIMIGDRPQKFSSSISNTDKNLIESDFVTFYSIGIDVYWSIGGIKGSQPSRKGFHCQFTFRKIMSIRYKWCKNTTLHSSVTLLFELYGRKAAGEEKRRLIRVCHIRNLTPSAASDGIKIIESHERPKITCFFSSGTWLIQPNSIRKVAVWLNYFILC